MLRRWPHTHTQCKRWCAPAKEPSAKALEKAERTGVEEDEKGAENSRTVKVSPRQDKDKPAKTGGEIELAAVGAGAGAELGPAVSVAVEKPTDVSAGTEETAAAAPPKKAKGDESPNYLFKSRSVHALLILGCIMYLKMATLCFQVSGHPEISPDSCFSEACWLTCACPVTVTLTWLWHGTQAVFCVPVTTRAYVPSPTAPGSGETVTEMRLAVDLLTVCYEGSHGTPGH